jgi:hypothetical protein
VYTGTKSRSSTGKDEAQDLAVAALAWLAEDEERLNVFLGLSGLGPQNLRAAAAEPGFLGAVLDHLAGNESWLITFAASRNIPPEAVTRARSLLNGRQAQDDS